MGEVTLAIQGKSYTIACDEGQEKRVAALGKSGSVSALLKTLGAMTPDERKLARARAKDLAAEAGLEAGIELDLHFDLPHAEPRGKVWRRHK